MKMTVKENINVNSIVLKHRIALETATLLEGRENLLYTDYMIYTMVSLVDNFIEENLIGMINEDERDFTEIIETDIENKFNELIEDDKIKELYDEILSYIDEYKYAESARHASAIGFLDYVLEKIGDYEWEDLKFFFKHIVDNVQSNIISEPPKKVAKPVTREEFEGADAKMKELLQKYKVEGQKIKEETTNNNE